MPKLQLTYSLLIKLWLYYYKCDVYHKVELCYCMAHFELGTLMLHCAGWPNSVILRFAILCEK